MSKLAAIAIVPLLGGTAAVVAWNLSLQDDLDSLRSEVAALQDAEPAEAADASEKRSRSAAKEAPLLRQLAQRVLVMEQQSANAAPVSALADTGAAGAESDTPDDLDLEDLPRLYRSNEFTTAVEGVLDAREERRRKERLEKQAARMSQTVLREIDVTDGQRADFKRLTLDYLVRRDEMRRDQTASEEERRARAEALDAERLTSLGALFDDTQMAAVEKRLRRTGGMRGGFGGRVRSNLDGDRTKKRRSGKRRNRNARENQDS